MEDPLVATGVDGQAAKPSLEAPPPRPSRGAKLHPPAMRIMHWLNVLAMLIMIPSGWGIYDDDPILGWLYFPEWAALGHEAQDRLLWHYAGMWLLVVNGLSYLVYGVATGRFRQRLLPIKVGELIETVRETLRLHLAHDDLTHYNAVQKTLYLMVIAVGVTQVLTGLAIWKPVQLAWLTALFGGFQSARVLHFLGMAIIVGFVLVHVALAVLVPKTLWAMLTGGPRLNPTRQRKAGTAQS
jgi:thiosulfate reductase cytochrome b subunit